MRWSTLTGIFIYKTVIRRTKPHTCDNKQAEVVLTLPTNQVHLRTPSGLHRPHRSSGQGCSPHDTNSEGTFTHKWWTEPLVVVSDDTRTTELHAWPGAQDIFRVLHPTMTLIALCSNVLSSWVCFNIKSQSSLEYCSAAIYRMFYTTSHLQWSSSKKKYYKL